ncbi:MAG: Methanogenesis regulatory histidine kinase FilI [ANME-2 cluster archaeon]|nr:Methanogenesis regulatory histidine kinase FilI [ANME-2 cluster archaeon]
MHNITRTGLIFTLIGTIAIAVASTLATQDTMVHLGIWLVTLILVSYAGLNVERRAPDEEARLISENSELKEAERGRNEFFARTVEELRIPLTSIDGHVELLLDQHLGKITKQQKDSLYALKQEINRITRMIIDIIELANIETGDITLNKEEISFGGIIHDVTDRMQQTVELKGSTLTMDVPGDIPVITGDRDRLTSAFANILINAIKFTSEGRISVAAQVRDGELLTSVSDTGIGIPESAIDKIFDRFYKVDTASSGTGLGLPMAKEIIEMHGGRIWAESKEGKGSTFSFTIPVNGL